MQKEQYQASKEIWAYRKQGQIAKALELTEQAIECTFRINGAPFPRQRCKRLALAVRYPFVVTC